MLTWLANWHVFWFDPPRRPLFFPNPRLQNPQRLLSFPFLLPSRDDDDLKRKSWRVERVEGPLSCYSTTYDLTSVARIQAPILSQIRFVASPTSDPSGASPSTSHLSLSLLPPTFEHLFLEPDSYNHLVAVGLPSKMSSTTQSTQANLDRYVVIHVATTCDEHGVYVTKDSAEVIELGWILLDAKSCDEVSSTKSRLHLVVLLTSHL